MKDFIGQTLGQYRLESLLGTGGMGEVYRGVHQLLDRPAAVKIMQSSYAVNSQFRARFLQEAKAAAALRHPHVVEIYEFGEQSGVFYLVMELLNDGSLSDFLRKQGGQPLPLAQALDFGSQIAQGLAAAHAMQFIHRDIKPANLLLRRQAGTRPGEEQYTVKINDFGLARLMEGGVETATGATMGTLAYMSPEQCVGDKQIDGRSDLYSLGVVLYEMATGYLPFQIKAVPDAVYKHVNTPPPPPRSIRPDLPPLVEEIILRCLAKKPEERFASGTALSLALQNALGNTGEAPTVPPPSFAPTRTALESPVAVATPPPVSTLPGSSDVPRVRVLDQDGQTLQVVEVQAQGLTVGRQSGNELVLNSQSVSRQHLRISWDGKQVMVKDLGSSNGTILGDTRLMPQVEQVWEERQTIRLGSFWLRLEGASAPLTRVDTKETPRPPVLASGVGATPPSSPGMSSPSLVNSRIGLTISPKTLAIVPGQPVTMQVTLTNMGSIVDWFIPGVEGVPAQWVQGAGQEVQLNPGMQETVTLIVNVARQPANHARDYPVVIRARSREQPQESSTTNATWMVQSFTDESMRLEPRRASGRGRAKYTLGLNNGGNLAARYTLSGDDDEQQLTYQFRSNPVELDAGQNARIPLEVQGRRRWIGREQRMPFQVHTGPVGARATQAVAGEFINKALLPPWVIPALLALLVIAGSAYAYLAGLLPTPGPGPGGTPTITITTPAQNNSGADADATATAIANANATATAIANANANANATATAIANANATATAQAAPSQLAVDPTSVQASPSGTSNSACSYMSSVGSAGGPGWTCPLTLTNQGYGNLSWYWKFASAGGTGAEPSAPLTLFLPSSGGGVYITPASGTIAGQSTQQVTLIVTDASGLGACPSFSYSFILYGPANSVKVTWSCA